MRSINIYRTVKLYKHEDGKFSYTDTYGELHEFDSANEVWDHLTEDGEEFVDGMSDEYIAEYIIGEIE